VISSLAIATRTFDTTAGQREVWRKTAWMPFSKSTAESKSGNTRLSLTGLEHIMKKMLSLKSAALLAGLALVASSPATHAQADYPTKPIRLVVPFPPGGTTDLLARIVAEKLGAEIGRPVVVDNKGGAGGAIGATEVARAAPDGYTIGMATASTHAINPVVQPKLQYDALKDFTAIGIIASVPNIMVVSSSVKAQDAKSLVALLRAQPGKMSYASPGNGSVGHFMGEAFKSASKTHIVHIPYRGAGPALNDVLAGTVEIMFDNLPTSLPHVQSGKLRAIAVASNRRSPSLPDVPTFAELGFNAANAAAWFGIVGPAKLPEPVLRKLSDALNKVLGSADVRARFEKLGADSQTMTPAQFTDHIRNAIETSRQVATAANIKAD
jgi:tripartite-type tricarboxylate transporter receptor subunit TctC